MKRARVPTIMQNESAECGAATLAMILAYHKRWEGLEALRKACRINRDGAKSADILNAARGYGLEAAGYRKDAEALATVPLPAILFWAGNHFVVLEQITAKGAWINDPGTGPRFVDRTSFEQSYSGVVLAFAPGADFTPAGKRASLSSILWRNMSQARSGLIYAFIVGVALLIPGLAVTGSYTVFTDDILVKGEAGWLTPLLAGLAIAAVLTGLLTYVQKTVLLRMETALGASYAVRYLWHVLSLPMDFFAHRYSGDITNRITQAERMAATISGSLASAFVSLVPIIGYGLVLWILDAWLAGIIFGAALLTILLLIWAARMMEDANRTSTIDSARLQGMTLQGLTMRDEFRASGSEDLFHQRWLGAQSRVLVAEQRSRHQSLWVNEAATLILGLAGVAVLVAGGFRIMDGVLTIGLFISVRAMMQGFSGPVTGLVGVGASLQSVRGIAERLSDAFDYDDPDTGAASGTSGASGASGANAKIGDGPALQVKNVHFAYGTGADWAVEDVSLSLQDGERIALVGGSGSGKSTLGRMLVGLAAPAQGEIALFGQSIADMPRQERHRLVAYVGQTIELFGDTIQDNITLWDDTLPEEAIVAAAQDAGIHDVITARPGGYLAKLAENGSDLSGGERQRLAIARALASQPRILVLDEATSALDAASEAQVVTALQRRGCAAVIISHRLSTIAGCDTILVMENGRITEAGTHASLMRKNAGYARLVES